MRKQYPSNITHEQFEQNLPVIRKRTEKDRAENSGFI